MKNDNTKKNKKELAKHIAAILNNPETPKSIFGCLSDAVTDIQSGIDYNSRLK